MSPSAIAERLIAARANASALPAFPGELPGDLAGAYHIQDLAIGLWADEIAGWKIGRVPPHLESKLGAVRLSGPIFKRNVRESKPGEAVEFPVYEGGFAAVEGEFVFRMGADAPAGKTEWSAEAAAALVGALHIGVETAGSPMADINVIGPIAVVSDFGNNYGLILGAEVPDWRARPEAALICETFIDGQRVGRGGADSLPGGLMGALAFLLGHLAARGRPLKAGQYVSTGAVTGVHDIRAGQRARVSFGVFGEIHCAARSTAPLETAQRSASAKS